MPPITTVVETGLYVHDLQSTTSFYHGILGLPVLMVEEDRHVFFRVGDSSVLLAFLPETTAKGETLPAHGAKGPGHFALGIPKESLEDWRDHLHRHGIAIEQEVRWPRGGVSLYFRDPSGNSVELLTPGLWGLPSGW